MPADPAPDDAGRSTLEVERKFEVSPGLTLGDIDLSGLPGITAGPERVQDLEATYYDTPGRALLRHRWVLRRRTGGHDEGWHLKRPAGQWRTELQTPLGRGPKVPAALTREVAVHARGEALAPLAVLRTTRRSRPLLDGDKVVAEVVLDDVTAALEGSPEAAVRWRELEVEVAGDEQLLAAVVERVTAAGARASEQPSKLGRALALLDAPVAAGDAPPGERPGRAARVVLAYLAGQLEAIQANDPLVRAHAPDAVHQMRVAARRSRSLLATYRDLFDAGTVAGLRAELSWLGSELGPARDLEVVRDHLIDAVADVPAPLRRGPVTRRVRRELDRRRRAAEVEAVRALGDPRYAALLDALEAFVEAPPPGPRWGTGKSELRRMTRRTWRKVRQLHEDLKALPDDDVAAADVARHEIRKAAKRARYAGEAMLAVSGGRTGGYAAAMATVQTVLGDAQDAVVARETLLDLADAAHAAGEDTFTYGLLYERQDTRGDEAAAAFDAAWAAASRPRVRRWFE
jgi:CHAD domain-containing protein